MDNRLPWDIRATDADGGNRAPPGSARAGRYPIVAILLTAAALDLTRWVSSWRQPGTRRRLPG